MPAMQTATTSITSELDTLSYPQKRALRALIEMLLLPEKPDVAYEILQNTPWLADLAKEENLDHTAQKKGEAEENDTDTDSSTSDEDELQSEGEPAGIICTQHPVFIFETASDANEDIVMVEVEA
ncbi:hypothetical protein VNI00_018068 [Paramarasmius palmivorus]|uniref:Uncharacterized protein n=1 Tax=Paramarasmius palmivorus TaxID=297713 RepID=A0AAW0B0C0_9AGAR